MDADICSIVRKNVYCSYMLEVIAAEVLNRYADSAGSIDDWAEAIIRVIALESKKHAEYIELIAKRFNLFEQTDCEHVVGEPWRRLKELLEQLALGVEMDLKSFIERQVWLERAVGEETYQRILLPLISQAVGTGCIDGRAVKVVEVILGKIASDEEWHEKMLRALSEA